MISLKPMIRLLPAFILMSVFSCKEPVPTKPEDGQDSLARFVLSTDNHKLTSLDLRIQWLHFIPPVPVTVFKNDDSLTSFYQRTTDTTLTFTGLTPSTDYRFTVKSRFNPPTLTTIETRTMDTTSHEFTWKLDTLGASGSYLRDVAIVNDTCVWVVGELLPKDYPNSWIYNAAMWNGKTWTHHRIETPSYPSGYMSAKPAYSIIYIDGLLWVTTNDGAYATSENMGKTWKGVRYPLGTRKGYITKGWASSKSNIYWVGSNGSITHFDGTNFRLVESGTDYDLIDIYPDGDGKLWIGGYKRLAFDGIILLLESNTVTELSIDFGMNFSQAPRFYQFDTGVLLSSVDTRLFQIGSRTFKVIQTESVNGAPIYLEGLCSRIRGTGMNNIFLGGARGNFWHFNGSTWYHFTEQDRGTLNILSMDGSKNLFIAVGNDISMNSAAIVTAKK